MKSLFVLFALALQTASENGLEGRLMITWDQNLPCEWYAALVPEDRPWSAPAVEAVVRAGARGHEFSIPAGLYRTVVGAPGYRLEYGAESLAVSPGSQDSIQVVLEKLGFVEGVVLSLEGKPIESAVVGFERAFLEDFSGRLSPVGESLLRSNFRAVTGSDGRFRLPMPAGFRSSLWVEATGHSPGFIESVTTEAPANRVEIRLTGGGALELAWSQLKDAPPDWTLQLQPKTELGELPRETAMAVWKRGVAAGSAEWTSLPPGDYELWLKPPSTGSHDRTPRSLGAFSLRAGERLTKNLGSLPLPWDEGGHRSTTTVRAFAKDVNVASLRNVEVWEATVAGEFRREPASARAVSGGSEIAVPLAGTTSSWVLVGPDWLNIPITTGSSLGPVLLESRRGTQVSGRVSAPRGSPLPRVGLLAVQSCEAPSHGAWRGALEVPAALEPNGTWLAHAPVSNCARLSLRFEPFAAVDWPARNLSPGSNDLGPAALRLGGALLVQVVSPFDRRGLAGVEVIAALEADVERWAADPEAGSGPRGTRSGVTDINGWVRLGGLAPGTYRLALSVTGRRRPHLSAPVVLHSSEEQVLDGLELPPGARLTVGVSKESPLLENGGRLVSVVAERQAPSPRFQLTAAADVEGVAVFDDTPAGTWKLIATAKEPGGRTIPGGTGIATVTEGEDQEVLIDLTWQVYRGRVQLAGVPLGGQLTLEPVESESAARVTAVVSVLGEFELPQAGPGRYLAHFTDPNGILLGVVVPNVILTEDERAEVLVDLPTLRVSGRVTLENGAPAPHASVSLTAVDLPGGLPRDGRRVSRRAKADDEGHFAFEAVAAGNWEVDASADSRFALEPITLSVARSADDLHLIIPDQGEDEP